MSDEHSGVFIKRVSIADGGIFTAQAHSPKGRVWTRSTNLTVHGKLTVSVQGYLTVTVHCKLTVIVHVNLTVTVHGKLTVMVHGNLTVTV